MYRVWRINPFLLTAALLAGCGAESDDHPRLGEVERLPHLEAQLPQRTTLTMTADLTATVDALEKADLCAQVRGIVKVLPAEVDIGRRVQAGEALVELDIPDLIAERDNKQALLILAQDLKVQAERNLAVARQEVQEAEAQVKRYEADLENRELRFQRLARLAASDTVQKQLADEARIERDAARAALQAAQAQVLTKRAKLAAAEAELQVAQSRIRVAQADLDKYNILVSFGTIRAPFTGIITKRWVDRGALVKDNSTPLLTVQRTDLVRVILDVPERDTPFLQATGLPPQPGRQGSRVVLYVPALDKAGLPARFEGEVTLLASALDPTTRTMRVEVHLPNPQGYLRPQMTGTATLFLGERRDVLTVPSSALVRYGSQVFVYYLADLSGEPPVGVVRKTEVEIGLDDGQRVEIRKGLVGTEQVIVRGAGVVHSGDRAIAVPARRVAPREAP